MKKKLSRFFPALALLALPAAALADTSVDSTTMIRFSQDDRAGFSKGDFVPATQFLGVDVDKLGDGNLSLHLYGWGRLDLADKSFNDNGADGSLTYGYLQYRFDQANGLVRVGRTFIREGIISEQVDGLVAHTDLPLGFGLTAFGGATVHTADMRGEKDDGKGDGIFGGRLSYRYGGILELGLAGVSESDAPSLDTPQHQLLENDGRFGSHRLIGGDIWLAPHRMVEIMGHSSYNTETEGFAEHSYLLNVKPSKDLVVAAEYNEYNDRDLFYSSVIFASVLDNLNDKSRVGGGSVSYQLTKAAELTADYKHYNRERGDADRFGANLRFNLKDKALRTGIGYFYLDADREFAVNPAVNGNGSFHALRGYAMHDAKSHFAALDAIAYIYRQKVNDERSSWEMSGSLGYRFTPALALSGDVIYGQNPEYDDELKGLLRLTYNMSYTGKGGTK
jgi:hypothetical protein